MWTSLKFIERTTSRINKP